jgi:hypothetical protein
MENHESYRKLGSEGSTLLSFPLVKLTLRLPIIADEMDPKVD